ncbi:MAG: thiamine pyrophosphate-dependent enzyme, partial [Bdellovibrionaceae bacterium]|nr:thiamine pyrophosphate-dependent enzyme [Pseudobdellovibrionaceae bacterium]
ELSSQEFQAACRPEQIHTLSAHTPYAPTDYKHPWLRWGSGALGCGMSIACGLALAEKLKPQGRRVYCLISEGDLNTGLAYQALSFASRMKLDALTFIFDNNGFQATSPSEEVLNLPALETWLKQLDIEWQHVDGHNTKLLLEALAKKVTNRTQWIWCKTNKAHRLDHMNPLAAHYASSTSSL